MTPEQKLLSIIERFAAGEEVEILAAEYGTGPSVVRAFIALARKCGFQLNKRAKPTMKEVWAVYRAHKAAEARAEAAE